MFELLAAGGWIMVLILGSSVVVLAICIERFYTLNPKKIAPPHLLATVWKQLKAGEMVFFNQKTFHGSFPNYSESTRHAVALSYSRRGEQIYTYIHNPETSGKTVRQYAVEKETITRFNNPSIWNLIEEWVRSFGPNGVLMWGWLARLEK